MSLHFPRSIFTLVVLSGCLSVYDECQAARWYYCEQSHEATVAAAPVTPPAPAPAAKSSANSNSAANATATAKAETTVAIYSSGSKVAYNAVQRTPQYDLRRPEVPSGARLTLFANFLGKEQGVVLLGIHGTSHECEVVDWKPQSVTIELPRLGLNEPKNATIAIVLPDGRIAKTFRVLFVAQPDVVVHQESVPQPMPPAPASAPAAYAMPVAGGLTMYAGN
jgi:hypothetical protein